MNLLLDTHILLWHLADNPKLSFEASDLIENDDHQKFLSIVSLWEIEIKRNIGKLDITQPIETLLPKEIIILPLNIEHIGHLKNLPFHHRDPFDRIIIAQAIVEKFTVITDDGFFKSYDVPILDVMLRS
ncbi:type II toxin-antitoxin system VapC family toxin [Methylobacter sp. G7]|uniref:type II toxin-antitoxin system VapC family toxin n=1 Tax=Methylobacter sp. G7 TaxID=3230117 RepID=UPI003D809EA2